jgi:hypothetical protein
LLGCLIYVFFFLSIWILESSLECCYAGILGLLWVSENCLECGYVTYVGMLGLFLSIRNLFGMWLCTYVSYFVM